MNTKKVLGMLIPLFMLSGCDQNISETAKECIRSQERINTFLIKNFFEIPKHNDLLIGGDEVILQCSITIDGLKKSGEVHCGQYIKHKKRLNDLSQNPGIPQDSNKEGENHKINKDVISIGNIEDGVKYTASLLLLQINKTSSVYYNPTNIEKGVINNCQGNNIVWDPREKKWKVKK